MCHNVVIFVLSTAINHTKNLEVMKQFRVIFRDLTAKGWDSANVDARDESHARVVFDETIKGDRELRIVSVTEVA